NLDADVEAVCFARDYVKADGTNPVAGETLAFKVTDLKKATKRIVLSHTKTYATAETKAEKPVSEADVTKKAVKKINSNIEKTTLGDLDALAALKESLAKGE
ncbi:MAG: 30S ribosomal protein S1, partial [Bacteroidales bacterium]|nr:30S ribosomal protein S1 [Bacteroidales bacterium]